MGEVEIRAVDEISFEITKRRICGDRRTERCRQDDSSEYPGRHGHCDDRTRYWWMAEILQIITARQLTAYRRDDIGFVFQFYNLVPNLTALENVELATADL